MGNKLTIAFARREAELYRSQGLFEEAQQLYREVLDRSDTLGSRLAQSLRNQIRNIEDELAAMEVDLVDYVSERDMQILKGSWRGANTPSDILPCATALGDIGLFEVGVEEYRKLIRLHLPVTDFVRGLTDCLLGIHSLDTIEGAIEQIINQDFPKDHKPVTLRAAFALDMERRGYYRTALSLYEKLLTEVPRTYWVTISKRIKTLKSKMRAQTRSVEARDKTPSSQPADKSARFHRRLDRLRKQLHQLRAFMQRRRHV